MLVVGELINSSLKNVAPAIKERNADFIEDLAKKQVKAGADKIDVNAGTLMEKEPEALRWLVEVVQQNENIDLCLDSPNPSAIEEALKVYRGHALINSITAERERFKSILPLIQNYNCEVVALCMDDSGMPDNAAGRVKIGNWLVRKLVQEGIPKERIFIDPLIYPVSTDSNNGLSVLNAMRELKDQNPGVHLICGLSNISFGLPCRFYINQAFLIAAMANGLDSVILNPLDANIMALLRAAEVILNRDEFAANYLAAYRSGKLTF